jgi:hypothetical protein
MKNYYKILGVDPKADDETIKKAYRTLAFEHHPDRHGSDSPEAQTRHEEALKDANEAYDTLRDPDKRARHDRDLRPSRSWRFWPGASRHETQQSTRTEPSQHNYTADEHAQQSRYQEGTRQWQAKINDLAKMYVEANESPYGADAMVLIVRELKNMGPDLETNRRAFFQEIMKIKEVKYAVVIDEAMAHLNGEPSFAQNLAIDRLYSLLKNNLDLAPMITARIQPIKFGNKGMAPLRQLLYAQTPNTYADCVQPFLLTCLANNDQVEYCTTWLGNFVRKMPERAATVLLNLPQVSLFDPRYTSLMGDLIDKVPDLFYTTCKPVLLAACEKNENGNRQAAVAFMARAVYADKVVPQRILREIRREALLHPDTSPLCDALRQEASLSYMCDMPLLRVNALNAGTFVAFQASDLAKIVWEFSHRAELILDYVDPERLTQPEANELTLALLAAEPDRLMNTVVGPFCAQLARGENSAHAATWLDRIVQVDPERGAAIREQLPARALWKMSNWGLNARLHRAKKTVARAYAEAGLEPPKREHKGFMANLFKRRQAAPDLGK